MSNEKPTIVVIGGMKRVVERLDAAFDMVRIDRGDPALLEDGVAARVEGIAAMGAVDAAFIDALPQLRIIANFGVGYDAVDHRHAVKQGIMVTNTPDVLNEEVADTAIGLLINTVRELPRAEAWLRAGRWASQGFYRFTPGTLRGRTVGIFGLGRIGRAIARRIEAFGLPVSYHNRRPVDGVGYAYFDTLTGLAQAVDTLICIAPGTPQTAKAVNADVLAALGPEGVLVNIGRGTTVDEEALVEALSSGRIMAAGLDVFANEPHVPDSLLRLDNVCLLPHVGSASVHTRTAMADLLVDNLISWFDGGGAVTPVPETQHLQPASPEGRDGARPKTRRSDPL